MRSAKLLFNEMVQKISLIYDGNEAKSIVFMVMEQFIGFTKTDILLDKPIVQNYDFEPIILRLLANEPIQYITGNAAFYGHKFLVKKGVTLIPRPETEELVHLAIKLLHSKTQKTNNTLRVLDIGTGSGCIAISLAKHIDNLSVKAIDISQEALEIATLNAQLLAVNIEFQQVDILNFAPIDEPKFDLIVSNPPYVTLAEKAQMHKNVLDFEPHKALFVPNEQPLVFYEKIGDLAKKMLKEDGQLLVEINENFGAETVNYFEKIGLTGCQIIKDINGKNRLVLANAL